MRLIQRGGFWWVDFRTGGKRRRVTTGVPIGDDKAKAAAMRKAGEIVALELPSAAAAEARNTLGAALDRTMREHWAHKRSRTVMARTVAAIIRDRGWKPVREVDYQFLKDYAEELLAAGKAPATVNRRMSTIGVALRECLRRGEIQQKPDMPHYTENNVTDRYLSVAEEAAVLAALDDLKAAARLRGEDMEAETYDYVRNLAVFLLDTGFRFSEAYGFTVVDGLKGRVYAHLAHGGTKTGAGRMVPLTDRAKGAAAFLLGHPMHATLGDKLARVPKLAWDYCAVRWQHATKRAGIPEVTGFHILRHTCASRLVQRGVPIFSVAKWLGHSSVKVTERYAKLALDTHDQALAALEGRPVATVPGAESFRGT